MKLMGADSLLAGTHQMNRHHPFMKRNVRILEDRINSDAESLAATGALPQSRTHLVLRLRLRFHPEGLAYKPALRANGTIRPKLALKIRNRSLFRAEILS